MEIKDTLVKKLTEQPFIVIILIAALYFQDRQNQKQVEKVYNQMTVTKQDYEDKVTEERDLLIESRQNLIEAIGRMRTSFDDEKTELYNRLIECERSKKIGL